MRPLPCLGAAALFALALTCVARPSAARLCLPPLFEDGQRLHPLTDVRVMWLDPLLRQHEICWRTGRDEVRIALFGNSAVFGFPLPADQSFGAVINDHFDRAGIPAHLFNLAWVFTYQLRDDLILHEALAYQPDLVVYVLTLTNLMHVAPAYYPLPLVRFFELNTGALARLAAAPPPGLAEPFERYRAVADRPLWLVASDRLRQIGYLTHAVFHSLATDAARRLGAEPAPDPLPTTNHPAPYDCRTTLKENATMYANFESWSPLADLADIRARTGTDVLVINWPDAEDPKGSCFNRRYGSALLSKYNDWLGVEAARLGLPYLDLHDLLDPSEFIDSLHVTPAGHRRLGERVALALEPLVQARLAARHSAAAREPEERP